MGDPFRKVQRGDRLRIPAETFNTFVDAAKDFRNRTQNVVRRRQPESLPAGTILVRNGTAEDLDRFHVLGIDRPIFTPAENLVSFQDQLAVVGVTPREADHLGRFLVLQEPLRPGTIGRACLSGVTPVRLNVLEEEHGWADIEADETDSLRTDTSGSACILWKEPPGGGGYGGYGGSGSGYSYYGRLRWALVRLGNMSDGDQWGTV